MRLNIPIDEKGMVQFTAVLFAIVRQTLSIDTDTQGTREREREGEGERERKERGTVLYYSLCIKVFWETMMLA